MKFYSFIFILFIFISILVYYTTPYKYRKFLLLLYNYLFYSYFDYRLTILLFTATTLNYLFGNFILSSQVEKRKNVLFILSIIGNILILGFFKYYNFFIDSVNSFTQLLGININLQTLNIILPLGISYYIFQTMTYVFDIYYGSISERSNFLDYAIFASFFALIISGPIERASTLIPQIQRPTKFNFLNLKTGMALISIGMLRKLLIADPAGRIVGQIFSEPQYYRSIEILVAIILYTFQLYNDFAGYSSIARGVAKLFGINVIVNFKQPFFSTSITDFWRRWNRSLAFWLRDYLFIPLQLKFRNLKLAGNVLAIMITFIICGIWHGSTWGNVLWGFSQGFYISFSLVTLKFREPIIARMKINPHLYKIFKIIFTFGLTVIGFFIARADSLSTIKYMISAIINWEQSDLTIKFLLVLFSISLMTLIIDLSELKFKSKAFLQKLNPQFKYALYIILWTIIIISLVTQNKLPFIYEKF